MKFIFLTSIKQYHLFPDTLILFIASTYCTFLITLFVKIEINPSEYSKYDNLTIATILQTTFLLFFFDKSVNVRVTPQILN